MFTRFLNKMKTLIIIVATLIIVLVLVRVVGRCQCDSPWRHTSKVTIKQHRCIPPKGRLSVNVYVMLGLPHTHTERGVFISDSFIWLYWTCLVRFTGGRQIKTNTFSAEPIKVNFTSHINMYVSEYKYTSVCTLIHHCPTYICTHTQTSS